MEYPNTGPCVRILYADVFIQREKGRKPEERDISKSDFCTLPPVFFPPTDDPAILERRRICLDTCMSIRKEPGYAETYEAQETLRINFGLAMLKYCTEVELQDALRSIETPALMMGGMEDVISRPELMIRTGKCLPHCKLVIHSGFGHMVDIYEDLADDAVRFYENVVYSGVYRSVLYAAGQHPDTASWRR